jgi:hypothetical protein
MLRITLYEFILTKYLKGGLLDFGPIRESGLFCFTIPTLISESGTYTIEPLCDLGQLFSGRCLDYSCFRSSYAAVDDASGGFALASRARLPSRSLTRCIIM